MLPAHLCIFSDKKDLVNILIHFLLSVLHDTDNVFGAGKAGKLHVKE